MSKKHQDLQPWLDYFRMLHKYERKGFLEMKPEEHEAYITRAAFCTLVPAALLKEKNVGVIGDTARRIRAYAGFKAQEGVGYLDESFAVNVLKEEEPFDPLFTIVIREKRSWWRRLWPMSDIEVVTYEE